METRTDRTSPADAGEAPTRRRRCKDADTRVRYLIVLRAAEGWSGKRIAKALGCSPSTVSRTLRPLGDLRRGGADRPPRGQRPDQGRRRCTPETVAWILESTPAGLLPPPARRGRALLIETAEAYTGVSGQRDDDGPAAEEDEGPPRPAQADGAVPVERNGPQKQRVAMIHALIDTLPRDRGVRVGGRGGHRPEPADRLRLDAAGHAADGDDAGEERQALLRRRDGAVQSPRAIRAEGSGGGR